MGRIFIHFRHCQRVYGTRLDAIATEHALGNIDIELTGETLQWERLIFRADDLDAARRTGCFAEVAPDTSFLPAVVPQETERSAMRVRNRALLSGILECNGPMKHVF